MIVVCIKEIKFDFFVWVLPFSGNEQAFNFGFKTKNYKTSNSDTIYLEVFVQF